MDSQPKGTGARYGYRLLIALLSPAILVFTGWVALKQRDRRYLAQRLGFYWDGCASRAIWVHAASVGEVTAAMPLVEQLRRRHGDQPILLTTATPTGARRALEQLPEGVEHAYLPVDSPGAVGRFLRRYAPRCALIMETELWPNLYAACERRKIPLVIVNGRLSARTLEAPRWVRRLYGSALQSVAAVLARSPEDARNFISLGAMPERVRTVGNIKFAALASAATASPVSLGRPYVLAASTRDGEETEILKAWRESDTGGRLLVIAPRHPARRDEILSELAPLGAEPAVRSRADTISGQTELYLADTLGELHNFIAGADLVFVGGSLVPKGGHNVLEPARLGKAVLFGPHTENFQSEAQLLLEVKAAVRVGSASELAGTLSRLLRDPERVQRMGRNGAEAIASRADMATRYLDAVGPYCAGPADKQRSGSGRERLVATAGEEPASPPQADP